MIRFAALVAGSLALAPILTASSEPLIEILVNFIILAGGIGILGAASRPHEQEDDIEVR
jgi:hypothetical protein